MRHNKKEKKRPQNVFSNSLQISACKIARSSAVVSNHPLLLGGTGSWRHVPGRLLSPVPLNHFYWLTHVTLHTCILARAVHTSHEFILLIVSFLKIGTKTIDAITVLLLPECACPFVSFVFQLSWLEIQWPWSKGAGKCIDTNRSLGEGGVGSSFLAGKEKTIYYLLLFKWRSLTHEYVFIWTQYKT